MPAPFKMPTPDIHLGNIVRNYLSTAAAITAGLPALEAMPRVATYDNAAKKWPVLVVAGAAENQSSRHQRVTVAVALHYQLPAKDAESPREQHAATMKTVNDLLHDQTALYAFIAALPEEQRTGWRIRRMYPAAAVSTAQPLDKENGEVIPTSIAIDIMTA